jgi:hypothetical protein
MVQLYTNNSVVRDLYKEDNKTKLEKGDERREETRRANWAQEKGAIGCYGRGEFRAVSSMVSQSKLSYISCWLDAIHEDLCLTICITSSSETKVIRMLLMQLYSIANFS